MQVDVADDMVRESGRDSDKERERETNCGVDHDTTQEGE